jgi:hypothetical protein
MTQTELANLALAKIGSATIRSIDDTTVKEAVLAKLHFGQARDEVLRAHFWGFACAVLAIDEEAAGDSLTFAAEIVPWAAAYAVPADFLKLRAVLRPDGSQIDKFDLRRVNAKRCLVTNVTGGILLHYVARVVDPGEFDPLFASALVTLLASKLARAISGSDAMEGQLRGIYVNEDLPAARMADGQDTQSAENHPLQEMLAGSLTGIRANFFPDTDDC